MTLLCACFLPRFPSGCKNATRRMFKGRKEPGIADVCVCTFHPHSRASVSHLMEAETEAGVLVCSRGGRAPRQPGPSFLAGLLRPPATVLAEATVPAVGVPGLLTVPGAQLRLFTQPAVTRGPSRPCS